MSSSHGTRKRKRHMTTFSLSRGSQIQPVTSGTINITQDVLIAAPQEHQVAARISRSVQRSANGRLMASTTTTYGERALPNKEVSLASRPDTQMNLSAGAESASANAEADVGINLHHPNSNSHHTNDGSHRADDNDLDTQINTVDEELPALHRQQSWAAQQRQTYLEEFYRLEGRGSANGDSNLSHVCHNDENEGKYRCIDCLDTNLYCLTCILHQHCRSPLHRIEVWENKHFVRTSLRALGLVIQLGHSHEETCALPGILRKSLYIIDTSGIHIVSVRFCRCRFLGEDIQLLRYRWYPASPTAPRTAFTLNLLNTFQLLTLQGKVSAYDFYLSIERKTDNAGIKGLQLRYDQFLICVRQFRHLRMLKRAGLGMDPEPVSSTKDGGYAVDCPACPHPGINIPANWETEPESTRWRYGLILTIDANFRLKNKDRHLENDKALGDGWGHWVPEGPYKSHLNMNTNDPEPNLCDSELRAVDHANKRRSNGYISTGVAGVVCARHGLVRRNGLGNLQKGKRYANTDFIVLSTLKNNPFVRLVLSYDICCQWSRNFRDRMANIPESMCLSDEALDRVSYVIPKFHLYGHGSKCQTTYSLSYIPWSAETDGEDPERWWAHINPVSMSTKIMGPGSRMDTIDDHAAAWNWRKIVDLGNSLHGRFQKAISMSARHTALHDEYTAEFNEEDITAWKQMIIDWESDRTKPNPFEEIDTYSSMAAVRLELAREEVTELTRTQSNSPNEFLYKGLEIEELQRVVSMSQKEKTTLQAAELQERRNNLGRRIELWRVEQAQHMPSIASDLEPRAGLTPETANLFLPSQLPLSAVLAPMQTREAHIRVAQADDSLLELRRLLRITAGLVDYKYTQVGFGQGPNTRARSQITRFKSKITLTAERYRAAYQALLCLDPQGSWITRLRKLEDNDIRWPTHNPDEAEGTREISWIWRARTVRPMPQHDPHAPPSSSSPSQTPLSTPEAVVPNSASDSEIGEALRVEWAKSHARTARWGEEVLLVIEEMRRVAAYLSWKAEWWKTRCGQRPDANAELQEGIEAYATRQNATLSVMRSQFAALWLPDLHGHNMVLRDT
ncbi:hypothetical protein PC9H_000559 [Pleurotus ostreatus]|uniref:CxC2-like cysteine cluster KDZ transposase-associated domain-containing protein n=1 Tax=Pleurotus ostreatus TaxID=5322 RepID=A0A8H7A1B0_PLEOS|nr:uncharacterized protein PC9H_000559 [Pleurotus ostreatus]KAF7440215.1 hypothetical protein PC9H_000559 [Pleurotus ostreatus]KAJ8700502.1 hypothetical protein PTI98_003517 [Pleurotus ostreatus]